MSIHPLPAPQYTSLIQCVIIQSKIPFMLRRIFGPKRDEVTGEWRKLHNEELNKPYSSTNIITG